jgi:hypothetical protein
MDAGSGINLIYAKTLQGMHISLEFLKPIACSFYGLVPGSTNYPLGRIALNLCFKNWQNYRREKLNFEVMDWPSQRDPQVTRVFAIHGSTSLYVPGTQNARAQRNHHS